MKMAAPSQAQQVQHTQAVLLQQIMQLSRQRPTDSQTVTSGPGSTQSVIQISNKTAQQVEKVNIYVSYG